jgi:DNA-binding beta-propeller fold protein YncE
MAMVRRAAAVLTAAACSVALVATPATAEKNKSGHDPVQVVAKGLNGPFQLSQRHGRLYVMESTAGQVTRINTRTGSKTPVITGLGADRASGATPVGHKFAIVTGELSPDDPAGPGPYPASSVLIAKPGHQVRQLADLLKYELRRNPDGQTQFGPDGKALDALSNPFYVVRDRHRHGSLLVADGGGNDVLRVNRYGKVSTFFVLPTINTGACAGRPNNDAQHPGCDGVPTGLAYGPGNTLYVSALVGEAEGEGRIYVLNASTGKVLRVIKGLTAPTGVAVDRRTGTVYVSELIEGAPPLDGPLPEGFDPSTIGQIVKITPNGQRSYAQVTLPAGLLFTDGKLYASAWSVAGLLLGVQDAGQVVKVSRSAFVSASS